MIAQALVEFSGVDLDILSTIAILIGIGAAIISLTVCVVIVFFIIRFLNENSYSPFELAGDMLHNFWDDAKLNLRNNFSNSPVGRALASHNARAASRSDYQVESYSLGPKEDFSDYDYSGYQSDYGNVEFVDLEDRSDYS